MLAAAPARGAPTSDLIPAVIVAVIAAAVVIAGAVAYRRDRFPALAHLGDFSERVSGGMPSWVAIPHAVATVSLLTAVFGFYWDVSWHIDRGRDPGPLANPAHWFIIIGLAGIALAGIFSMVLGDDRVTGSGVRLTDDWTVPVGGLLLSICGLIALAGFPLDDVWHRIFGQDVTLWGPTHVQMIGGASLATLAMWVLHAEGQRAAEASGQPLDTRLVRLVDILLGGAFLIGLSTLQGEFDFGVPQFNQLFHPTLIMLAAGIGLVAVRVRAGKGSTLLSVAFFLAMRGVLALLIGPVFGRSLLHFPLYIVEALVVEAVALRVPARERPLTLGLWAGIGIGTVGLAAEWLWTQVFMPLPWRASLLPWAVIWGFVAAVAGGVIGGLVGRALSSVETYERSFSVQRLPRAAAAALVLAVIGLLALPMTASSHPYRADLTLDPPLGLPDGKVRVTARLFPADAAKDANWFNVTAWQGERKGDGGLVIADMKEISPGVYRSDQKVPVYGEWKALLRLHKGRSIEALPIYLPADPGIPAPMVAPFPNVTRNFQSDKSVLQREAVGGSNALQRLAYGVLGVLALVWVGSLAWGLRRLERAEPPSAGRDRGPAPTPAPRRQPLPAGT
jgi:hypothetical protein